ncbi:hypothetical protein TIFTF001_034409 [Ficus carica]|uniref:RNase H type-1 domain-containing protein n=1 Tax=Ficus carica TaxID=3494 RepID=A0AA88E059_FICCA|nr:hypothetical protein TIFTF001_034409 [Ficus carica]
MKSAKEGFCPISYSSASWQEMLKDVHHELQCHAHWFMSTYLKVLLRDVLFVLFIHRDNLGNTTKHNLRTVRLTGLATKVTCIYISLQAQEQAYYHSGFIKMVHWHPPFPGWIKIDTDGAANGYPGQLELLVVIAALDHAKGFSWDNLWFESDSANVVDLLKNKIVEIP